MCLILFANDCHPRYQLVVAANRDEFYSRPTLPASFWPENQLILAGKDMHQGGTWMGITAGGRFAALTNYRDPSSNNPQLASRGHLVKDYLNGNEDTISYLENIDKKGIKYNGFNLLAGTCKSLYYYSNQEKDIRKVEEGIHGLSNSLLDVFWPKVSRGIKSLTTCLQDNEINVECLFEIMADREQPHDKDLPQTGVGLERERMLAPSYVVSQDYGTRSTTVLLVDRNNRVQFWERSYPPAQSPPDKWNQVYYDYVIEGPSLS